MIVYRNVVRKEREEQIHIPSESCLGYSQQELCILREERLCEAYRKARHPPAILNYPNDPLVMNLTGSFFLKLSFHPCPS